MKKHQLKLIAAFLTFILGVTSVAIWFYPILKTQNFDVPIPAHIETETADEYAVYSTVLRERIIKNSKSIKLFKISDRTALYNSIEETDKIKSEEIIERMKKNYLSVDEEILTDYYAKQLHPFKFRPQFNLPVEYVLVDAKK